MRVLSAPLVAGVVMLAAVPVLSAQNGTYPIKGDDLAIYNLAGLLRVEPATGSDVVVVVQTGGADAGRLKVATGVVRDHDGLRVVYPDDVIVYPVLGRHSNTTMDVNDDGTFGIDDDERGGRRVRIRGDGSGLEAWADLTVKIPAGKTVQLRVGVGKATVTNVDGIIKVSVGSSDVSATGVKDRKSTRLNSSHPSISYAVFCLKKKKKTTKTHLKKKTCKKYQNNSPTYIN